MPIVEQITVKKGVILNWHITETVDELEVMCGKGGILVKNVEQHEMRKKQQMVTMLLHKQLHPGLELSYAPSGKPFINTTIHVSISHSGEFVTMMSSDIACGIDIEKISDKVVRIRHKFLNDIELSREETKDSVILTKYWSAKEAMYKVHGSEHAFLRNNIFVEDSSGEGWRLLYQDRELSDNRIIKFRISKDMVLAWTEEDD